MGSATSTVVDRHGSAVASVTSRRADARRRRAERAGVDGTDVLATLFGRRTMTTADAGIEVLDDEVDLAAVFGRW